MLFNAVGVGQRTVEAVSLTAGSMTAFDAVIGDGLFPSGDVDLYRLTLAQDQTVSIDIDAAYDDNGVPLSSLNSYLRVFDANGSEINVAGEGSSYRNGYAQSPNDYGDAGQNYSDDFIQFTATQAGVYFVGVSSDVNRSYTPTSGSVGYGYSSGAYRLQLLTEGTPTPQLSVSVVDPDAESGDPTNPLAASDPVKISEDDGQAVFNVTLNQPSDEVVTVQYTTVSGTATGDEDFLTASGTLTFAPGETSQSVTVAILYDGISETSELFSLEISNAEGAEVAADSATVLIANDDPDHAGDSLSDAQWLSGYLQPLNPVTMQATIGDGLYANQDIDLYRIELGAEQSISIDIDAGLSDDGSNLSDLDSLIRVFDSLGRDVTSSVGVVRSGDAAAPGDFDDGNGTVESADDYLG